MNFCLKFIYIISTIPAQLWQLGILITAQKPAEGALGNALFDPNTLKRKFPKFYSMESKIYNTAN